MPFFLSSQELLGLRNLIRNEIVARALSAAALEGLAECGKGRRSVVLQNKAGDQELYHFSNFFFKEKLTK